MVSNDPFIFQEFRVSLGTRDPKTVAAYLTTMRDFVAWLAAHWSDGTTSSFDGQRFPVGGPRSHTAQINGKYGSEPGLVFYTHISDQMDPYYTKVITGTPHGAPHLIDGLLYHETELNIQEHYADTGGYTDQVFGLCHLLGFRFAPSLRDLGDRKLYSIESPALYPHLDLLMGGTINTKQITDNWDELLRLTASLLLRKLASYPRQNGVAWALREVGRIEKRSLPWNGCKAWSCADGCRSG